MSGFGTIYSFCALRRWSRKAFLKARISDNDLDRLGNTTAQLVDGKAQSIALEFEHIFHSDAAGVRHMQLHADWASLDPDDQQFAWNLFASMLIQNACSFERRIVRPLSTFPLAILGMGKVRHDLPCQRRQQTASRLLAAAAANALDVSSMKIVRAFKDDIHLAACNGRTGLRLFVALKALRRMWRCDVRPNEGLNKTLKLLGERSPNSSLDLVSSRLALKH